MERSDFERGVRAFLSTMDREHKRRFPGYESRVPNYDHLALLDRRVLLLAMENASNTMKTRPQAATEENV